ncbi:uncharacterized protein LOC109794475 [Cajanus cajan]|nr:uncharacterized protein LOC109794475 [Cajanus cajan]
MKNFDATNFEDQTALDLTSSKDIKKKLVQARAKLTKIKKIHSLMQSTNEWLVRNIRVRGHMSEQIRSAYLVVTTLVATTTYHAALSPPGGLHQIGAGTNNTLTHMASNSSMSEGKSIMSNVDFIAFSTTNICAFIASILTIISLLPRRNITWFLVYAATGFLIISYYYSMATISPNNFTTTFVSVAFYFLAGIFTVMVVATMMLNSA